MTDLFDLGDLPNWLQVPQIDEDQATIVRRAASGWLQDATSLTQWPDPIPDRLWAWAVELAAIARRNPDGLLSEQIDDYQASLDRQRRTEILAAARAAYNAAAGQPQYSFPEPDWHWEVVPNQPRLWA